MSNRNQNKGILRLELADAHAFSKDRKLVLGGVSIAHSSGLLGHSDADVLTHGIMDALLGACGLGDIGLHFPDSEDRFKGVSSLELLGYVKGLISTAGYKYLILMPY